MAENSKDYDYCKIIYQMRYKGEDPSYAGNRLVWLVFQAIVSGNKKDFLIHESTEIPLPTNVIASSLEPQKNNPGHTNVHQILLYQLRKEGWELLPNTGEVWWQRRLRRPAQ